MTPGDAPLPLKDALAGPLSGPLRMPGATLVTRLKVYDTPTPDGQRGGTPHLHLLCTEMYFVLAGHGAVEMLDADGFDRVELHPHDALVFSPGTLHRLINPDGELELLVVMQNSGLPERGDNVVCFPEAIMRSQAAFDEAMAVANFDDAYRRRDRGVEGFLQLKEAFARDPEEGRRALSAFYDQARERTAPRRAEWRRVVEQGAAAEAARSLQQLAELDAGRSDYLLQAEHALITAGGYRTPGFCGALDRYFDPATLELEGVRQGG